MDMRQTAPSGSEPKEASRVPSSDQGLRRPLTVLNGSVLEWGSQVRSANWWDSEFPCAPIRARAESQSDRNITVCPPWGRERSFLRGGGLTMRRIFSVLSALAALFLVGGAAAKW